MPEIEISAGAGSRDQVPPTTAPAGAAFTIGDVVYNASPATGAPVGWVWAGATPGWRPSGTIG